MSLKFFLFLFLGFLSTYAVEIKAEESCNYSTRKEYKRCKKEGANYGNRILQC